MSLPSLDDYRGQSPSLGIVRGDYAADERTFYMKQFTLADTQPWAGHLGLFADRAELIHAPLWWHERGLQQTASGYGRKLTTQNKIHFEGRTYRIYCTCFSNAGSCWFIHKGQKIFVN